MYKNIIIYPEENSFNFKGYCGVPVNQQDRYNACFSFIKALKMWYCNNSPDYMA
jgi:hypothetical protein